MLRSTLHFLGRQSWIGTAVVLSVCAVLAARTVDHLVEARYAEAMPAPLAAPPPAPPAPAAEPPDKDGSALADRNMFCSDCDVERTPPALTASIASTPAAIQRTSLPLTLIATQVGSGGSVASIVDAVSRLGGAYSVGDSIPGAGVVRRVGPTSVDFLNEETGRVERISLFDPLAEEPAATSAARPALASAPRPAGGRAAARTGGDGAARAAVWRGEGGAAPADVAARMAAWRGEGGAIDPEIAARLAARRQAAGGGGGGGGGGARAGTAGSREGGGGGASLPRTGGDGAGAGGSAGLRGDSEARGGSSRRPADARADGAPSRRAGDGEVGGAPSRRSGDTRPRRTERARPDRAN